MAKGEEKNEVIRLKCVNPGRDKVPRTTIYFFLLILFSLGFDFGFAVFLKPGLDKVVKTYCYTLFIAVTMLILYTAFTLSFGSVYLLYLMQYVAHFICVRFANYNISDLIIDLHAINTNILIKNKNQVGIIAFIYTFILFWSKMSSGMYCVCYLIGFCTWYFILNSIPCFGLDVIAIVQILASFYIYSAMNDLHKKIQVKSLKETVQMYKRIVDCDFKIKPLLAQIMCVEVITLVPKLILCLLAIVGYFTGHFIMVKVNLCTVLSNLLHLFHALTPIFIPSLIVEMTKSKLLDIKQEISHRIVKEKDEERKRGLVSFMRYMDGRPPSTMAWNVLPFDVYLPIIVFNATSTFLIFIIQYLHMI